MIQDRDRGTIGGVRLLSVAHSLSWGVAGLMVIASAVPLVRPDLYRDNDLVASGWLGNDLVTLLIGAPGLVIALLGLRTGSARAHLVWMGFLAYAAYNYAFYLFGAALNPLFLAYVGVLALAVLSLAFGAAALSSAGSPDLVVREHRGVAVFILAVVLSLGGFWLAVSLHAAFTGRIPAMVLATGSHTNLIAALDLALIVPSGALAGLWLWKRRAAGSALAVIWTVQGAVYMTALAAATLTAVWAGQQVPIAQAGVWSLIGAGCLISSWRLLGDFTPGTLAAR